MKYSGNSLLGQVPKNWSVKRLKNTGCLYGGLTGKAGDDFNVNDGDDYMLYIPFTNIFNNFVIDTSNLHKVRIDPKETQNLVMRNDLLFLMSSEDIDGVGKPAIIESQIENLGLNSFCKGLRINNTSVFCKFLFYYLLSHPARELVRREAKGFIRINLRQDKLACTPVLLPPLPEQQRIAAYLDEKCADIDNLVSVEEGMIEELQAYKQSVITEAVTKGLDPDTPMKNSGVEWIPFIPATWAVEPLKANFEFGKGLPITKEDLRETGEPVISYGQIHAKFNTGTTTRPELLRFVSSSFVETNPQSLTQRGDFIFADTSEDTDGCGNCAYIDTDYPVFAGYHTIIARPKNEKIGKYFAYLFRTDYWRNQIRCRVAGIKLFSITLKILAHNTVIIPPVQEQQRIAAYLDEKCADIDALIAIKRGKIEELKEYKKSLIYEAVTGKIDLSA